MSKDVREALKTAREALRESGMEETKSNLLKILVDYYGLTPKQIEEIKFK